MRSLLAAVSACVVAAFPAAASADAASASGCLPAKGTPPDATSVRGMHVGARALIKGPNGNPLKVNSVSYCIDGGGIFSFALSTNSDVVLSLSTADGDSIGPINPTSPAMSARMAFPNMRRIAKVGNTSVFRVAKKRQLILGVAAGRVNFVAAADRLLLDYPGKLAYYLKRLGF